MNTNSEKRKKQLILIVDDVPINLEVLDSLLGEKYDIAVAISGEQSLELVDRISPDLILLDIIMPEMDGFEVCRRLKSSDKTKEIPIIFLTGKTETEDVIKGFETGATDYVTKPFNTLELLARVHTHLELKRSRDIQRELIFRLQEKTREVEKASRIVATANKNITESIRYAKMIQLSLLPNPDTIKSFLPESFFIWMPRDIVGGDFIFCDYFQEGFIIALIDCTGHGVPGAFVTMIASFGLRKIIRDQGCHDPARILSQLSFIVKTTLQQDTGYALSNDGLDAAVCFIPAHKNSDSFSLTFAGANLPLYCLSNGEVITVKGDRQSLGYKRSDLSFNFSNHTVPVKKGMMLYMATDGITDQLGGEKRCRFGTERFKQTLRAIDGYPCEKQRELILRSFEAHKGDSMQVDDVTVMGFRFGGQ